LKISVSFRFVILKYNDSITKIDDDKNKIAEKFKDGKKRE